MSVPGALGTNAGADSDGVLIGQLTATDPDSVFLKSLTSAGLCYTDDGGLYLDETTPFNEATADDVEIVLSAAEDANYFGHATIMPTSLLLNLTTQGDWVGTVVWEYWDGDSWEALADISDGTTAFEATTGWKTVSWTAPSDWAQCTVDGVNGYWCRARVNAWTSITTQPQLGQGWIVTDTAVWTDDTTDFTDVGAADVKLLPDYPTVGDGIYIGHSEKFCKLKVTTSTARTGTATLALKYWNGSAWTAVTTVDDDSIGWSAVAGTHLVSFVPPTDWAANTTANGPNGTAGYFVVMELTVLTDVTAQPVATQGWVYPIKTGASGLNAPQASSSQVLTMTAQTKSGTTQDSNFLLIDTTRGTCVPVTWTKADQHLEVTLGLGILKNDELALVQVTEDGTTEFADVNFGLLLN
jgi:hypothetical protein